MVDRNTQKIGSHSDGNIQINGDGNVFSIQGYKRPLVKTKMFKLLKIVQNSNLDSNYEFSLDLPTEIFDKLSYNNAPIYSELFADYIEDYIGLDSVIKNEFENSESIIKRIRGLFLNQLKINPNDGDKQLDSIREEIKELIFYDPNFLQSDIDEEEVDQFAIALLQYGVSECKILKPKPSLSRKVK